MKHQLTSKALKQQSEQYRGTGGSSECIGHLGFQPAFFDSKAKQVHFSRFADGRPAPFHTLNGLPEELVISRDNKGRVTAVVEHLISGFAKNGEFFTRDQCEALSSQMAIA